MKKTYVMLLDDFLEAGIIELCELCEIMHIRDNIAQILLQKLKILLGRAIARLGPILARGIQRGLSPRWWSRIEFFHNIFNFFLGHLDTADDLTRLNLLEGEDLLELCLEDFNKGLLVIFRPFLGRRNGGVGARGVET